jgi:hypothetical protein
MQVFNGAISFLNTKNTYPTQGTFFDKLNANLIRRGEFWVHKQAVLYGPLNTQVASNMFNSSLCKTCLG